MVSSPSTLAATRAATGSRRQGHRALSLLWYYRELPGHCPFSAGSPLRLASLAQPSFSAWSPSLGAFQVVEDTLPTPICRGCALGTPSSGESMTRRAGCANRARPDLWGAGEGNLSGLPDSPLGSHLQKRLETHPRQLAGLENMRARPSLDVRAGCGGVGGRSQLSEFLWRAPSREKRTGVAYARTLFLSDSPLLWLTPIVQSLQAGTWRM